MDKPGKTKHPTAACTAEQQKITTECVTGFVKGGKLMKGKY